MQSHQPEEEYLLPALFDEHPVRQVYDKTTEMRWFSVVEVAQILTQQPDTNHRAQMLDQAETAAGQGRQSVGDKLSPTEIALPPTARIT